MKENDLAVWASLFALFAMAAALTALLRVTRLEEARNSAPIPPVSDAKPRATRRPKIVTDEGI